MATALSQEHIDSILAVEVDVVHQDTYQPLTRRKPMSKGKLTVPPQWFWRSDMDTFRQELFIYLSETFSGSGIYKNLTATGLEDWLWDHVCPYGHRYEAWLEHIKKVMLMHVAASAERNAERISKWRSSRFRRRPSPLRESFVPEEAAAELKVSEPVVSLSLFEEDSMDIDLEPIYETESKPLLINWMWREKTDEEEDEEEDFDMAINFRTPSCCPLPEQPKVVEDEEDMTKDVVQDVLENPFIVQNEELVDPANEASTKETCDDLSGDSSFAKSLLVDGCWLEKLASTGDIEELVVMMSECVIAEEPEECWTPLNSDYEELIYDDEDDWDEVVKSEDSKEQDAFWML